jgi:hypothetical protein
MSTPSKSLEPIITFAARENMDFESVGKMESSKFDLLVIVYRTCDFNGKIAYEAYESIGVEQIWHELSWTSLMVDGWEESGLARLLPVPSSPFL